MHHILYHVFLEWNIVLLNIQWRHFIAEFKINDQTGGSKCWPVILSSRACLSQKKVTFCKLGAAMQREAKKRNTPLCTGI